MFILLRFGAIGIVGTPPVQEFLSGVLGDAQMFPTVAVSVPLPPAGRESPPQPWQSSALFSLNIWPPWWCGKVSTQGFSVPFPDF